MGEERTLAFARALETRDEDLSKEELQLRMEEARGSISQTVTEIKETAAQQYETVKDALDWREHFKKQPVAWTLGAAGVGFFVGYGIAAAIKGESDEQYDYVKPINRAYAGQPIRGEFHQPAASGTEGKTNGDKNEGPGLVQRFKETRAFDRLQQEVGSLGDRLIDELSTTAQTVILPALIRKVRDLIGADLSDKSQSRTATAGVSHESGARYQSTLERNPS
ncbi:MAG: hypothetical protein ACR2G5_05250 [Pyrinomonadaceae bacterium]